MSERVRIERKSTGRYCLIVPGWAEEIAAESTIALLGRKLKPGESVELHSEAEYQALQEAFDTEHAACNAKHEMIIKLRGLLREAVEREAFNVDYAIEIEYAAQHMIDAWHDYCRANGIEEDEG